MARDICVCLTPSSRRSQSSPGVKQVSWEAAGLKAVCAVVGVDQASIKMMKNATGSRRRSGMQRP